MNYKKAIASIEYMNASLKNTFKHLDFNPDQIKSLHNHCTNNRWGIPDRVCDNLTNSAADMIGKQITEYMSEIRGIRVSMRPNKRESALDREASESKRYACSQVHEAFPSASFSVGIGKADFEPSLGNYSGDGAIHVPVSWNRKIYQRGISVVKAGDGNRFIVDCKARHLTRLAKDNIQAFDVLAIKRYGGNSEMIEATVMKYDAGGTSVCSIADKFSRAESLIRRRIKDTAIDTLLEL